MKKKFNMTRAKVKQEWIRRLESGNYKQTKEVLYSKKTDASRPSYCCLGVLCKVLEDNGFDFNELDWRSDVTLPVPVAKFMNMNHCGRIAGDLSSLARYNDLGHSFKQIAQTIKTKKLREY